MSTAGPAALLEAVRLLAGGSSLSRAQAQSAFIDLLEGRAGEAQSAAFLMGLRVKGETVEDLAGCVSAMRQHAVRIEARQEQLVDTCGTGGDGRSTANISTLAALVVAGCGVAVAKHGNRSVSSRCGSADLLEALGVTIDLEPEQARRCLEDAGMTFLFAPRFHPAMRYAAPVRKALGVRTILNLLGPLSNPAGARRQLVGVFDPRWLRPFAEVLRETGAEGALVVHGGGMDELDPSGPSRVAELKGDEIREYTLEPAPAGVERVKAESVWMARAVLEAGGEAGAGAADGRRIAAVREAVVLNAGAALVAAGACVSIAEGVQRARSALRRGAAREALERLVKASRAAAARA